MWVLSAVGGSALLVSVFCALAPSTERAARAPQTARPSAPLTALFDSTSAVVWPDEAAARNQPQLTLGERWDLPEREDAHSADVTRLRLWARTSHGEFAENACFEIESTLTTGGPRLGGPERRVVKGVGPIAEVELPASVLSVRATASAPGRAPGWVQVERLRVVDGQRRTSGLVERDVVVNLDAPLDGPWLEGSITVDGRPGAPADLELTVHAASGGAFDDRRQVIDRSASTYRLPLPPRGALRLHAVSEEIAPMWLIVPAPDADGHCRLDLELNSGRDAVLSVVDARTQSPLREFTLRVEVAIESWSSSNAQGVACRPVLRSTNAAGELVLRGLPEQGLLTLCAVAPPRRTELGFVLLPGEILFRRELREEDPPVLRARVEVRDAPPPTFVVWGEALGAAATACESETTVVVATVDQDRRERRSVRLRDGAPWEIEVPCAAAAHAWLECGGKRVSAPVALPTGAGGHVGPIVFCALPPSQVLLSWSGAAAGDRLEVVGLGALVDEQLLALTLDAPLGCRALELRSPMELGIRRTSGSTIQRRIVRCDPALQREIHVSWTDAEPVELRLRLDGLEWTGPFDVDLRALDAATADLTRLSSEGSRIPSVALAPGRYFFRVHGADSAALVCGIAERAAGAQQLWLVWSGCPYEASECEVVLRALGGVELDSIAPPLRTLTVRSPQSTEADGLRPRRLRLPCESDWSPDPRLRHEADQRD